MIQFLYRKFLVKSLRKWVSETRRLCPLLFSSALTSGPTCNWQPSFFRCLCIIKIKLWMDHHKRDAPTLPDNVETARNMQILPWDQEFINVDQEGLSDILIAAHYLDIKPLVQLGCRTGESQLGGKTEGRKQRTSQWLRDFLLCFSSVADQLRGVPLDQLRKMANVDSNLSQEEQTRMRKEIMKVSFGTEGISGPSFRLWPNLLLHLPL